MDILDALFIVGLGLAFVLALAWYDEDGEKAEREREDKRCSQCKYRAIAILYGADVKRDHDGN